MFSCSCVVQHEHKNIWIWYENKKKIYFSGRGTTSPSQSSCCFRRQPTLSQKERKKPFDYNFLPFNFQYEYLKISLASLRPSFVASFLQICFWLKAKIRAKWKSVFISGFSLPNWKEMKIRERLLTKSGATSNNFVTWLSTIWKWKLIRRIIYCRWSKRNQPLCLQTFLSESYKSFSTKAVSKSFVQVVNKVNISIE